LGKKKSHRNPLRKEKRLNSRRRGWADGLIYHVEREREAPYIICFRWEGREKRKGRKYAVSAEMEREESVEVPRPLASREGVNEVMGSARRRGGKVEGEKRAKKTKG